MLRTTELASGGADMWARTERAERRSMESQVPQWLGRDPQTRATPLSRAGSDRWPVVLPAGVAEYPRGSQGSLPPRVSTLRSVGPISPHQLPGEPHNFPCDAEEAFSSSWRLSLLDLGFSSRPGSNCSACPWGCLFIQNEEVPR